LHNGECSDAKFTKSFFFVIYAMANKAEAFETSKIFLVGLIFSGNAYPCGASDSALSFRVASQHFLQIVDQPKKS
jgi:hypothetical protein